MYQVGVCYDLGIGVETDKQKAFEHYKNSAKGGNSKGFLKWSIQME
jgi:TPR repeat protein